MKTTKIRRALLVGLVIVLIGGGALLWHERSARATVAEPTAEREPALVNQLEGAKAGANKDHELLQGTWNIDAMEFGGKSIPKEVMKGYKYVFAGNKLTWDAAIAINFKGGKVIANDGVYPCDFKIDPAKQPKEIDITFHFDKTGDRTILGIYEIKGDTLKVCFFTSKTGKRPEDFSAKDSPSSGYVVLTRAKVAEPAPEKGPGADKVTVGKELELLQGTWNVDTQGWGDKDLPKELMKGYKFVFAGNKLTWDAAIAMNSKSGKITAIDGAYPCNIKIDPGKEPKEIDITFHFDKTGDRTVLGIFEIKGDTLRVCYYSNKTGKRPIDFDPDNNPNIGRVTLTRAKK